MIRKCLHFVRCVASYLPGGRWLAHAFMSLDAKREHLRCLAAMHANGLAVCNRVNELLAGAGIEYWADQGTLLGLIRENKLIDHDTDLDFSTAPGVELSLVCEVLLKAGFVLKHGYAYLDDLKVLTFEYRGVSMDFDKCHDVNGRLGHYCFVAEYDGTRGALKSVMAHERVRTTIPTVSVRKFRENVAVAIPDNAEELLEATYGDWRTPDTKTDFCGTKVPSHYRDIYEGCRLLTADEIAERFVVAR